MPSPQTQTLPPDDEILVLLDLPASNPGARVAEALLQLREDPARVNLEAELSSGEITVEEYRLGVAARLKELVSEVPASAE